MTNLSEAVATAVQPWVWTPSWHASLAAADEAIEAYERTVPSDRLQAILRERRHAVNEIAQTGTLEERAEPRTCHCGRPFQPGQAYAVDGPEHIGCRR